MADKYDTPEQREIDRERDYRERREIYPSKRVQERYSLAEYPCGRCEKMGPPHLVDNGWEFYWEHQPEGSGRSGCPRFSKGRDGNDYSFSLRPRTGTATSLWMTEKKAYRNRVSTEAEYIETLEAVENGADGHAIRRGWG